MTTPRRYAVVAAGVLLTLAGIVFANPGASWANYHVVAWSMIGAGICFMTFLLTWPIRTRPVPDDPRADAVKRAVKLYDQDDDPDREAAARRYDEAIRQAEQL